MRVLLARGFFFGAVAGFLIGVAMGWSRPFSYWATPLLRYSVLLARALAMARSAYTSTLNTTNRNRAVRPALM